jgi:RNA polymerase sigma factor (sigma-70 family)
MTKKLDTKLTNVTRAFIENTGFLKAFLSRFLHRPQDIEDIAQEAYLRLLKSEKDSYIAHPKALLFTVAKNLALNELRSKARRVTGYIEECQIERESVGASIEEELEALDSLNIYCAAVDALPEQCRRVYLLRKVHGLPQKDIAERLGVTLRTVERHLQYGVIKCRAYIREKELPKSQELNHEVGFHNKVVNVRKNGRVK